MMSTELDLEDAKDEALLWASRRVGSRYRAFVTAADLLQEGEAWVRTHPKRVDDFFRDATDDRMMTVAMRRFGKQVEKVMEKVAREEKAVRSGYRPEDEAFYGLKMLEAVMPVLYNPELAGWAPVTDREEISAPKDAAESGTWLAQVLDIKRAYERIDVTTQESTALYLRFGVGLGSERAGEVMCMGRHAYRDILDGVMRRLAWQLQGQTPEAPCPRDCEHVTMV